MLSRRVSIFFLGLVFLLSACDDDTDTDIENDLMIDRGGGNLVARYNPNPEAPELPSPNNLAFIGSADGTLNLRVDNESNAADPKVALNSLDGFSTVAPISTTIGAAADSGSFASETIKLFEVALDANGLVDTSTSAPVALVYGVDYIAAVSSVDLSGKTIAIVPIKPLKPKTSYLAALTTGIQSTDGRNLVPDSSYNITKSTSPLHIGGVSQVKVLTDEQAVALEALRPLTNAQESALAGQSIVSSSVAVSWVFSTQSIGDVLTAARGQVTSSSALDPTPVGTASVLLGGAAGIADVYAGTLTLPYYLTNANSNSTDPLSKQWMGPGGINLTRFTPTPIKISDESVPLLVSVPNNVAKPGSGWPVVMFQHGITTNRSNMLAIAETLAGVGFAVVAIDLPLHGLPPGNALYSGIERTFDLDLVDNTTTAPGADGTADTSGTHFINLSNLQVTRDNLRQGIADQFALFNALSTMDYDTGGADFDTSRIYFLGHSLGGMMGSVFAALEPNVRDIVLAMPGGGIAKLLDGSARFGPVIEAGLAAGANVIKGTADYESFLGAAQTLMDSGDPINYTQASNPSRDAASDRGVLMFEIVGDSEGNLPDQVIPNNVTTQAPSDTVTGPLSGTDPLFTYLGLTIGNSSTTGTNLKNVVRFTAGDHASILDPTANATVTTVMQTAVATFFATDGNTLTISNTSVVE